MCVKLHYYKMCNNTQKKKAAGAGKDFTLFFGVMLHFNFKCAGVRLTPKAWELAGIQQQQQQQQQ